jgi:hypothetical protein
MPFEPDWLYTIEEAAKFVSTLRHVDVGFD